MVDIREEYSLNEEFGISSIIKSKDKNQFFAIKYNKDDTNRYIIKLEGKKEEVLKVFPEHFKIVQLHYSNNKLYFLFNNRLNKDVGMATLNLNDGKLDIILRDKNIDNIYDVSNDILVYSKIINQKRNIYSFNENAEKLLVEDAHNPNFINNKQFLFLKDPYASKICLYDLNDKKITYVGNNYNRIWRTNLTMLNDKYFIVKKHIIPYDPLTQYTVSGTNGVMLILPIKGPVAINEK